MYFLVLLRKAGVSLLDIVNFHSTSVRSLLEYCVPVFQHALPSYLSEDLERIQKRALNVISPGHSYCDNLARFGLKLQSRRESLCLKLFQSILSDERFSNLVPPRHKASYNLRHSRSFTLPRFRTDRYKRSLIPAMCKYFNS